MKSSDRIILIGVIVAALLGASWMLVIKPKRAELADLDKQVASTRAEVDTAEQEAQTAESSQKAFPDLYRSVVRIGKAVPEDSDTAALMVQLGGLSSHDNLDFRSIELDDSAQKGGSTSSAPTPTASKSTSSSSSSSTAQPAGSGAAKGGTSTTASTGSSAKTSTTASPPSGGSSGSSTASSSSSSASSSSSPPSSGGAAAGASPQAGAPTESAAAALPLGATVGEAGFPVMPYKLKFEGDFFGLMDFMHGADRLVRPAGQSMAVRGRLVTIDGFSLAAGRHGFPGLEGNLVVTTYVTDPSQGLTAGATPAGPSKNSSTAPVSTQAPAPGGATPPAATAGATP